MSIIDLNPNAKPLRESLMCRGLGNHTDLEVAVESNDIGLVNLVVLALLVTHKCGMAVAQESHRRAGDHPDNSIWSSSRLGVAHTEVDVELLNDKTQGQSLRGELLSKKALQ
jgi:hypothetical protein